jgi:DNA-binding LacI/PurR family transcriptional regulator
MTTPARRVTASDVARSLGISRATVGFVLNGTPGQTIPEATRSHVLAEASASVAAPPPLERRTISE